MATAIARASTTEKDMGKIPDYAFDKLQDGAKMRLLEIQPAPNASETLNCKLIHVPVRKYRPKKSQTEQQGNAIPAEDNLSSSSVVEQPDVRDDQAVSGADDSQNTVSTQVNGVVTNGENQTSAKQVKEPEYDVEMPPYEALSYRWGSGEPTCSIRIHKNDRIHQFRIHKHLHDALIELRHESNFRNIWIDTLCVNQEDPVERSEQVARMNEIYGEAFNVCIWLGQPENGSTEALQFLKGMGLSIYDFDERCGDESFVRRWASFLTLLKRDWFARRWVVQEVSLARSATVHCGSTFVDWEDFSDAVSLLHDIELSAKKLSNSARKMESLDFPADLFGEVGALPATHLVNTANRMFKKSIGGHQRISSLEQIVARLAMFQSGEPRDYIYALLALAKDSQPYAGLPDYLDGRPLTSANKRALQAVVRLLPRANRQSYDVDYKQEVVDVYQQFIAFALSKSDPALALDVICRPFAPSTLEGLPSWIPVVSELPFAPQLNLKKGHFKMERQRGDPFVSMPDAFPQYNAAGRKPLNRDNVRFRKRSDHYSMFVEGFVLDTIVQVEPASQMGNIPEEWVALANDQTDKEAFWKTLVADRGPKGGVPGIYGKAIKAALQVAENGLDVSGHMREHPSTIVSDALPHVQNTIWGRCLIETKRQHLGLGPKKLEKASRAGKKLSVCIIYGCSVPIILQECEKTEEGIAKERQEDEDDRLKRQKKAEPYILRWAEKLYERRNRQNGTSRVTVNDIGAESTPQEITNGAGLQSTSHAATDSNGSIMRPASIVENVAIGEERIEVFAGSKERSTSPPAQTNTRSSSSRNEIAVSGSSEMPTSTRQNSTTTEREKTSNENQQRVDEGDAENHLSRILTRSKSNRPAPRDPSPSRVYYEVVGESYIHNMMHGEAIKYQNDSINSRNENRVKTQIFELR